MLEEKISKLKEKPQVERLKLIYQWVKNWSYFFEGISAIDEYY